jgi:Tol biopolymer transport system component
MVLRRSDQNSIFIGNFDSSSPSLTDIRRLTLDERTSYPHAWTADGRAVIFESDRNGNFDLLSRMSTGERQNRWSPRRSPRFCRN